MVEGAEKGSEEDPLERFQHVDFRWTYVFPVDNVLQPFPVDKPRCHGGWGGRLLKVRLR